MPSTHPTILLPLTPCLQLPTPLAHQYCRGLCKELDEPKVELLTYMVKVFGMDKAQEAVTKTKKAVAVCQGWRVTLGL